MWKQLWEFVTQEVETLDEMFAQWYFAVHLPQVFGSASFAFCIQSFCDVDQLFWAWKHQLGSKACTPVVQFMLSASRRQ